MAPEQNDFRIDLTFTGQQRDDARPIGIAVAIAGIIFIILTMTTGVAARILPMSDEYLLAMIPAMPDGSEPISLTAFSENIVDKTITVNGTIMNRSARAISSIVAVVQMVETTGRFPQTVTVPVMPTDLQPQASGTFTAMATLQEKPSGYSVKFRFADGPFIPHKKDLGPAISITPQPIPLPAK